MDRLQNPRHGSHTKCSGSSRQISCDSTSKQGVIHTDKTRKNPGNRLKKNTQSYAQKKPSVNKFHRIKEKQVFLI